MNETSFMQTLYTPFHVNDASFTWNKLLNV